LAARPRGKSYLCPYAFDEMHSTPSFLPIHFYLLHTRSLLAIDDSPTQ
jgi:hypothetical protein